MMRKILFILLTLAYHACSSAQEPPSHKMIQERVHPYLIMTSDREASIRQAIEADEKWRQYHLLMIEEAKTCLDKPICKRTLTGKRLLDVSRECLRRILLWGYAYRMTGEMSYATRAQEELNSLADFTDWNPSHFLDVAEMTTAAAIGYDWLYSTLSESTRKKLEQAIISKGINPSLNSDYNNWLSRDNNWNQVCNGGITLGALAIYDQIPNQAAELINRAINSIRLPMKVYAPEGAYPEGYSYWGYGTTYNLMLIDALKSFIHSDYGLTQQEGFLSSAKFIQHMILSDGYSFNYGDCASSGRVNPCVFWMANHSKQTDLLWSENYLFSHSSPQKIQSYRYAVLALIWGADLSTEKVSPPSETMWVASKATVPVALMRTSWNYKQGMSLAIKGGTAQAGHAHLDAGSFVFVNNNIRWAIDLGPQDYNSLESKGIDLWNRSQQSDRWKVLRYNNFAHNTLTFNNELQNVNGNATITEYANEKNFKYAIINLTPVYKTQVKKVMRGTALSGMDYAIVRDEIETAQHGVTVRWNMATKAKPTIIDNHTIQLAQEGETLILKAESDEQIVAKTWNASPTTEYDAPNPGVTFVGFEVYLKPNSSNMLQVTLITNKNSNYENLTKQLKDWKKYVR